MSVSNLYRGRTWTTVLLLSVLLLPTARGGSLKDFLKKVAKEVEEAESKGYIKNVEIVDEASSSTRIGVTFEGVPNLSYLKLSAQVLGWKLKVKPNFQIDTYSLHGGSGRAEITVRYTGTGQETSTYLKVIILNTNDASVLDTRQIDYSHIWKPGSGGQQISGSRGGGAGASGTFIVDPKPLGNTPPDPSRVSFNVVPNKAKRGQEVNLQMNTLIDNAAVYYNGRSLPKKVHWDWRAGKVITVTIPGDAVNGGYFELAWDAYRVRAPEPFTVIDGQAGQIASSGSYEVIKTQEAQKMSTMIPLLKQVMINPNSFYKIVSKGSGKCIEVGGNSQVNGANAHQWEMQSNWQGGVNQQWRIMAVGSGFYKMIGRGSGKCLEVAAYSRNNGGNIQQWDFMGHNWQQWQLISAGGGYYKISSKGSGKCLDIQGGSKSNGGNIQQFDCHGNDNQLWKLTLVK
jgi:hypothetical protein